MSRQTPPNTIIATAPGRCGLVGNPSDMYGGAVISCTVQERAECRLEPCEELHVVNDDQHVVVETRADLEFTGDKLDIARAALKFFDIAPETAGFSLSLRTDIPMKAGMSGSTAMLATLVGVMDAHLGLNLNRYALAETTRKIEARVMGIVCGLQDQHMAIFGGLNFMDYAGKEMLEQHDDEPLATIEPLADRAPFPPLILAHTGIQHHSGTVHKSPRERWLAGEPLVRRNYAQLRELAIRGKRALVEGDWAMLGSLMDENHVLVSELGGSGDANDRLIHAAKNAGAWGAKLAGAGGGGTIIALGKNLETLGAALLEAGAERLLYPKPVEGLGVSGQGTGGRGQDDAHSI